MNRDFNSPEEQERLDRLRAQIDAELPELIEKGYRLAEAAEEKTLSGELRRAIHASRIPLTRIARDIGVTPLGLDSFLTGDATLPSDAIDRLAATLGYSLTKTVEPASAAEGTR